MEYLILVAGLSLLAINVYGLFTSLRPADLLDHEDSDYRFLDKNINSYKQALDGIDGLAAISDKREMATQANSLVNRSLVHIDWPRVDPARYRLVIPARDNFILHVLGVLGFSDFKRYHFTNLYKTLERGVGICGDASNVLSGIFDRYAIPHRIVSFNGHVIIEYLDDAHGNILFDPDFGVMMTTSLAEFKVDPDRFRDDYARQGFTQKEVDYLFSIYAMDYCVFDNTYHFMTKRYLFERGVYVVKWLIPGIFILYAVYRLA